MFLSRTTVAILSAGLLSLGLGLRAFHTQAAPVPAGKPEEDKQKIKGAWLVESVERDGLGLVLGLFVAVYPRGLPSSPSLSSPEHPSQGRSHANGGALMRHGYLIDMDGVLYRGNEL